MESTLNVRLQNNTLISEEIDYVKQSVAEFRANLNTQGVWLFLSTLGCWSVQGKGFQLLAITITFYIFTFLSFPPNFRKGQSILLKNEIKKLRGMVDKSLISDGDKQFWLQVIDNLCRNRFSFQYAIKTSHFFYVSYFFLVLSTFKLIFDLTLLDLIY
jgi:hypothetical protein